MVSLSLGVRLIDDREKEIKRDREREITIEKEPGMTPEKAETVMMEPRVTLTKLVQEDEPVTADW